jgi:hypothetical protein
MSAEDEVIRLLRSHEAVLVRQRKHAIYRFPDGRTFTLSRTPSCFYADHALADLRRLLNLDREVRKNPDRKGKPGAAGSAKIIYAPTERKISWRTQLNQAMRAIEQRKQIHQQIELVSHPKTEERSEK